MPDNPASDKPVVEVISPENTRRSVSLTVSPFSIGRGEVGNQLAIPDRRISRNCAAILSEGSQHFLEDRGNQLGVFVNAERISTRTSQQADVVTVDADNSNQILCHPPATR